MAGIAPTDYSLNVQSPLQAFNDGLVTGTNVRETQQKIQQQALAAEQQLQLKADLAAYAKNPSSQAIAALSMKYPQLSEQFKRSYDMLAPEEKEAKVTAAVPIYAAALNNKPDVAIKLLEDNATALENSGNKPAAAQQRAFVEMLKAHPEQAKTTMGLLLSSAMGADKFSATFGQLGTEKRAEEKQPAEVLAGTAGAVKAAAEALDTPARLAAEAKKTEAETKNLNSQVTDRANRLALDKDKLQSEVQLKLKELGLKPTLQDDARKIINESVVSSTAAEQTASQMLDVASRVESVGSSWGRAGGAAEFLKEAFGGENEFSSIRKEVIRLTNQQAIKNLPQGSASDADVAMAREAFLNPNANPKTLAAGLRTMAKLQQLDAVSNKFKSEWVNANGSLGKSREDTEIDGIKIPAGSSYIDFSKQFLKAKVDTLAAEQEAALKLNKVKDRSYMKYGVPEAPARTSTASGKGWK